MTEKNNITSIPYEEIVQDALLVAVRKSLEVVVQNNGEMPGEHHFYVTFKTHHTGVKIPDHLMSRFPESMTIVLQNRYSNLVVREDDFSVNLSFSGVPATLTVPYSAITNFVDPHVEFGLEFKSNHMEEEESDDQNQSEDTGNVLNVDFRKR